MPESRAERPRDLSARCFATCVSPCGGPSIPRWQGLWLRAQGLYSEHVWWSGGAEIRSAGRVWTRFGANIVHLRPPAPRAKRQPLRRRHGCCYPRGTQGARGTGPGCQDGGRQAVRPTIPSRPRGRAPEARPETPQPGGCRPNGVSVQAHQCGGPRDAGHSRGSRTGRPASRTRGWGADPPTCPSALGLGYAGL